MLLDSKKKLVAFGHDADDRYSQICEANNQKCKSFFADVTVWTAMKNKVKIQSEQFQI
jgi:hypothetical protein